MAASKYNSINKTSVPSLTNDYITANTRQGGSYYSNYHRQLPKILIGATTTSGASDLYVPCSVISKGGGVTVSGYIANEYLFESLKLYYRIDEKGEFILVPREPFSEWSFTLSSIYLYTSNSSKIELKLEGLDTQGKDQTYTEIYNIIIEENCMSDLDCKGSMTEAIVRLNDISLDDIFMIVINNQVLYAESLTDLKNILLRHNVELEVYTKTLY